MSRASAMRAVLAFLALWLTTSGALAEKAIFFAPTGHRDLAASVGPAALEALEHGLRDAGWETLSPAQAGDGLDELGVARCTGGACVPEMLTALEADTAVGLAIWARHGQTAPYEVALTFMPKIPPAVNATALVQNGDVLAATRDALAQALLRWSRRHQVTLRVVGQPAGAAITLDGRPAGRLPYEAHVSEGSHDVSISLNGHITERRELEIPEQGAAVVVQVALAVDPAREAGSPAATASGQRADASSSRDRPVVGPVLLAVAGVVGVAWGSWASSGGGCLEHNAAGACVSERRFSSGERVGHVLAIASGGLALVGAVLWFSLGGSQASPHDPHASLGLAPDGLRLSLQF